MRSKPLYLKLFPILAIGIALSFPVQIFYLYGIPLDNVTKVLTMLTPLNLLSMVSLMIISVMSFTLSRAIYKFIPALLFLLFANNAIVGLYGTDYSLVQVGLSFVLFGLSLKPFYNREIRAIILNPQLRWWSTPQRFDLNKPLQLQTEQFNLNSISANASTTGIFAEVQDREKLENFDINQVIDVKVLGEDNFTLKAKVVRKSDGDENSPSGFGLEFIRDKNHKRNYIPWLKDCVL